MFQTLICPPSGACDYIDGLPHRLPCSVKTNVFAIIVTLRYVMVLFGVMCFVAYCGWWVYYN